MQKLMVELPSPEDVEKLLACVLDAVYASFQRNWDNLECVKVAENLASEAIWLGRLVVALMPDDKPKDLLTLCSTALPALLPSALRRTPSCR